MNLTLYHISYIENDANKYRSVIKPRLQGMYSSQNHDNVVEINYFTELF